MATQDVFWPATRNDIHWGIWSGAALIALVTVSRAVAGALSQIHPVWVWLIAAGVIGGNLLTWWWSLPQSAAETARAQVARGGIAICPALVLGVVLAGASVVALIGVLVSVACGLAFVVVQAQQRALASQDSKVVSSEEPANDLVPSAAMETAPQSDSFNDPLVQQQIVRRRSASGGDSLEALLRIAFGANQREASIHLPIQPAFSSLPVVECEPLDDADVDMKVASLHTYGLRIDVKRTGGDREPATVAIGVVAESAAAAEAAA